MIRLFRTSRSRDKKTEGSNNGASKYMFLFFIGMFCLAMTASFAPAAVHPRIFTSPADKKEIIKKISDYAWAKSLYISIRSSAESYVDRHLTDPAWILSRIPLNWRRPYYTDYDSKWNSFLVNFRGDAPFPTIMVSDTMRPPRIDNIPCLGPALDDCMPYTDGREWIIVPYPSGHVKVFTNSHALREGQMSKVATLACAAATVWWLTGEEKFGRFSADIVTLFMKAGSYNNMVGGHPLAGFLSLQSIYESVTLSPLFLALDFIKPYLIANQGRYTNSLNTPEGPINWVIGTNSFQDTFCEKMATMVLNRGWTFNNYAPVETGGLVFPALCLNDPQREAYYMDFFTTKAYVNSDNLQCGQIPVPMIMKNFDQDGMWNEPPGYHTYPMGELLPASIAADRNGYNIFQKHPQLFKASYILSERGFPDRTLPGYGDGTAVLPVAWMMDVALAVAIEKQMPERFAITTALNKEISYGYRRNVADGSINRTILRLMTAPAVIPVGEAAVPLPRAQFFTPNNFTNTVIQRNGEDIQNGMMFQISGTIHGHNHQHGPALEMFAKGYRLGIEYGMFSVDYETAVGRLFYRKWASHNNVVVNAKSSSPGRTQWETSDPVYFKAEPTPGAQSLSEMFSWVESSMFDSTPGSLADQLRHTWLVRLSQTTGVFVDVYRSGCQPPTAAGQFHDYLYHGLSTSAVLTTPAGSPVSVSPDHFTTLNHLPDTQEYGPGYSFFSNIVTTGVTSNELCADFVLSWKGVNTHMRAFVNPGPARQYFIAQTPRSWQTPWDLRNQRLNALVVRRSGEAWKNPFAVVYAPSVDDEKVVQNIRWGGSAKGGAEPAIVSFEQVGQNNESGINTVMIFSATNVAEVNTNGILIFAGLAGAVVTNSKSGFSQMYLAKGRKLSWDGVMIESVGRSASGASLTSVNGRWYINTLDKTRVTLRYKNNSTNLYSDLRLVYARNGNLFGCEATSTTPNADVVSSGMGTLVGTVPRGEPAELRIVTAAQYELLSANDKTTFCTFMADGNSFSRKTWVSSNSVISIILSNSGGFSDSSPIFRMNADMLGESDYVTLQNTDTVREYRINRRILMNTTFRIEIEKLSGEIDDFVVDMMPLNALGGGLVYPNPVNRLVDNEVRIKVPVASNSDDPVLVNMIGQVIYTFKNVTSSDGYTREYNWDLKDSKGSSVLPGLYFIIIPKSKNDAIKLVIK